MHYYALFGNDLIAAGVMSNVILLGVKFVASVSVGLNLCVCLHVFMLRAHT